ncbi:MAG: methyltransferase domain-containing protein [Planctomycetes bacterium]|nr:methyltransferase domain-containing protein [Planctomycetota bacterium]
MGAVRFLIILCVQLTVVPATQDSRQTVGDPPSAIPDVVFIPTPRDVVGEMLRLAGVKEDDVVYDLGCGDGRIVVEAARKYGCRAVGYDIDPLRVEAARERARLAGVEKRVTIHEQDLFTADLHDATVVTLYLSTKYNTQLVPQLKQLRPGARVVSLLFEIPGTKPDQIVRVKSKVDGKIHVLFLWTAPL